MPDWKSFLKHNTLEWLLEEENPSVRYFTLIDLLNKKPDSSEVKEAKSKIMTEGPVPIILSKQKSGGYWGDDPFRFYLPKLKATFWTFLTLAEFAANRNDRKIRQTCKYIFEHIQDKTSGAFAPRSGKDGGGDHDKVLPCHTGLMIFSFIRFGYLNDPRIQKGIDWFVKYQRFDDGVEKSPKGWPYSAGNQKGESCWGKHTCHVAVVGCLKALSEIPKTQRSNEVKSTLEQASEYMLKHHIYKRSHDLNRISIHNWINLGLFDFGFLGVLSILAKLDYKDDRMQDAVDLLISKQNKNGRWPVEENYDRKFHTNMERKGEESKWVTLNALRALKNFYE